MVTYEELLASAKRKGLGASDIQAQAGKMGLGQYIPPITQTPTTTPQIDLGNYNKFGSNAMSVEKTTPGYINTRNDMIIKGLGSDATDPNKVKSYLGGQQGFSQASLSDQQNTINNIVQRAKPTVATPNEPIISKTFTNDLEYDPSNPEDYLMKLNAKVSASNKKPTETELYNMYKAQKDLQNMQLSNQNNPIQAQLDQLQAKYDEARKMEGQADTQALEAYKKNIEAQYAQKIAEAQAQGEKQKIAAQNVYSFSGFGRSSAAANKQADIEKSTQGAINTLNAAKEQAIALEEARLRGDDPESLKGMQRQLEQYQQANTKFLTDSIAKTAEANQKSGSSYIESINNIMTTVAKAGLNMDENQFKLQAQALQGMTPQQQTEYLANFTPEEQLLLKGVMNSTPQKTVTIGSGKNAREMQRNPATQKYDIPVGGGVSRGGTTGTYTGSYTGSVNKGATIPQEYTGNATDLIDYNAVKFKNDPQTTAFTYATRMIEASDVFNKLENDITSLKPTEYIYQKSLGELPYGSSLQSDKIQQQSQAEKNFINAVLRKESGAAIAPSEFKNAQQQYFPQPGDSPATLENKRKNRLTAIKGISASSGQTKILQPAINAVSQKKTTKPTTTTTTTTISNKSSDEDILKYLQSK